MDFSQIMQMLGNQGGNQDFSEIMKTFSGMQNNSGNNNMLNLLLPLLMKNNPNMNSIMPLFNMMQGGKTNNDGFAETQSVSENEETSTVDKNNSGDYLIPISNIANKDITYILNRFFSGN